MMRSNVILIDVYPMRTAVLYQGENSRKISWFMLSLVYFLLLRKVRELVATSTGFPAERTRQM